MTERPAHKVLFLGGPLDGEVLEIEEILEAKIYIGEGRFEDGFPGGYHADVRPYFIHWVLVQDAPGLVPVYSCYPDADRFSRQLANFESEERFGRDPPPRPRPGSLPVPAQWTIEVNRVR